MMMQVCECKNKNKAKRMQILEMENRILSFDELRFNA
jgi:hypothetical protein